MSAEDSDDLTALRAEVQRTREELGDTVEALAYKADVKARARDKVDEIKTHAAEKVDEVKAKAAGTAEQAQARAEAGVGQAKRRTEGLAGRAGASLEKVPAMAIAGGVVGLALLAIVWRRRAG